jgi:hypothetical protein
MMANPPMTFETGGRLANSRFHELAPEENYTVVIEHIRRLPVHVRPPACWLGLDVRGSEGQRSARAQQLLMIACPPRRNCPGRTRFLNGLRCRYSRGRERKHQPDALGATRLGLAPYSRCFDWRHQ